MPRVSVICAAYNGSKVLPPTLRALQAQDEPAFEVVVVDDASTDSTPQLLAELKDPRFRVLTNSVNLKLIATRNRAIEACRASYIAVTDQDDPSHPARLRCQADYLDAHPEVSAVYTLIRSVDANGRPRRGVADWSFSADEARAALLFHNFVSHSTLMFRRDRAPYPVYAADYPLCEDYKLLVELSDRQAGLHVIRKPLVDWRYHESNHSHDVKSEMGEASVRLRRTLLARLGLNPSDSEMALHQQFESTPDEPSLQLMRESAEWLGHLGDANARSQYVPAHAFENVLAAKWLEFSHKCCGLGPRAWLVFQHGPSRALLRQPAHWASAAKLAIKCQVTRR